MLAALHAGRLDVDSWFEEQGITRESFDEWMEWAECQVDLEKIAHLLAIGFSGLMNRMKLICESPLVEVKQVPDAKPKDFIFWDKPRKKSPKRNKHVSPNAGVLAVRAAVGRLS